jgi:hypothetical protein
MKVLTYAIHEGVYLHNFRMNAHKQWLEGDRSGDRKTDRQKQQVLRELVAIVRPRGNSV